MKTVTEFAGVSLRSLLTLRQKLWNEQKAALKDVKKEEAPAPAPVAEAAAVETAPIVATDAPAPSDPAPAEAAPAEEVPAPAPVQKPRSLNEQVEDRVREELSKHLTETMKLEGEKLEWMLHALSLVDARRATDLRRVVVYKLLEGEKAPGNVVQKGEAYFMTEYLAPVGGARPSARGDDRKRDGKGGRGKGRGGERGDRNNRGDRGAPRPVGDRGPRPEGVQVKVGGGEAGGQRPPRPPRAPRPPREPRAPRPPREPRPALPTGVAPITVQTSGIPAKKLSMPVPKSPGEPQKDAPAPDAGGTPQG